jgi:hypothetical protein
MNKRFLIIILGTATGIEKDLNFIADGETGVNFVDGKGMFICTFYSPYSAAEIHERMVHRPAVMIFDITDSENYGINLPSKYYLGIFPEIKETLETLSTNLNPTKDVVGSTKAKVVLKKEETTPMVEEYESIDEILDKLSRNNYDRTCLTVKELEILNKG